MFRAPPPPAIVASLLMAVAIGKSLPVVRAPVGEPTEFAETAMLEDVKPGAYELRRLLEQAAGLKMRLLLQPVAVVVTVGSMRTGGAVAFDGEPLWASEYEWSP